MNFRHFQKLSVLYNSQALNRAARLASPKRQPTAPEATSPTQTGTCALSCSPPKHPVEHPSLEQSCYTGNASYSTCNQGSKRRTTIVRPLLGTKNVLKLTRSYKENLRNIPAFKINSVKSFARNELKKSDKISFNPRRSATGNKRSKNLQHNEDVKLKRLLIDLIRSDSQKFLDYPIALAPYLHHQKRFYSTKKTSNNNDGVDSSNCNEASTLKIPELKMKTKNPTQNDDSSCPEPPSASESPGLPYFYRRVPIQDKNGKKRYEMHRVYFKNPQEVTKEEATLKNIPKQIKKISKNIVNNMQSKEDIKQFLKKKLNEGVKVEYLKEVITKSIEKISEAEYMKSFSGTPQKQLEEEYYKKVMGYMADVNYEGMTDKQAIKQSTKEKCLTVEYKRRISTKSIDDIPSGQRDIEAPEDKTKKKETKPDIPNVDENPKVNVKYGKVTGKLSNDKIQIQHILFNNEKLKIPPPTFKHKELNINAEEDKKEQIMKDNTLKTEYPLFGQLYSNCYSKIMKKDSPKAERKNIKPNKKYKLIVKMPKKEPKEKHLLRDILEEENTESYLDKINNDMKYCERVSKDLERKFSIEEMYINKLLHQIKDDESNANNYFKNYLYTTANKYASASNEMQKEDVSNVSQNEENISENLATQSTKMEKTSNLPIFECLENKIEETENNLKENIAFKENEPLTSENQLLETKTENIKLKVPVPISVGLRDQSEYKAANITETDFSETDECVTYLSAGEIKRKIPNFIYKKKLAEKKKARLYKMDEVRKLLKQKTKECEELTSRAEKYLDGKEVFNLMASGNKYKKVSEMAPLFVNKDVMSMIRNKKFANSYESDTSIKDILEDVIDNNVISENVTSTDNKNVSHAEDYKESENKDDVSNVRLKMSQFNNNNEERIKESEIDEAHLHKQKSLGNLTILLKPLENQGEMNYANLEKIKQICKKELETLQSPLPTYHLQRQKTNFSRYLENNLHKTLHKTLLHSKASEPDDDEKPKKTLTILDQIWSEVEVEANKIIDDMQKKSKNKLFLDRTPDQLKTIKDLKIKASKQLEENYNDKNDFQLLKEEILKNKEEKETVFPKSFSDSEMITNIMAHSSRKMPSIISSAELISNTRQISNDPKLKILQVQKSASFSSRSKDPKVKSLPVGKRVHISNIFKVAPKDNYLKDNTREVREPKPLPKVTVSVNEREDRTVKELYRLINKDVPYVERTPSCDKLCTRKKSTYSNSSEMSLSAISNSFMKAQSMKTYRTSIPHPNCHRMKSTSSKSGCKKGVTFEEYLKKSCEKRPKSRVSKAKNICKRFKKNKCGTSKCGKSSNRKKSTCTSSGSTERLVTVRKESSAKCSESKSGSSCKRKSRCSSGGSTERKSRERKIPSIKCNESKSGTSCKRKRSCSSGGSKERKSRERQVPGIKCSESKSATSCKMERSGSSGGRQKSKDRQIPDIKCEESKTSCKKHSGSKCGSKKKNRGSSCDFSTEEVVPAIKCKSEPSFTLNSYKTNTTCIKREQSCPQLRNKSILASPKEESPCKKKKKSPCSPCKKKKKSPCTPCKPKKKSPCNPCKPSPCGKKPSPCKQKKQSPCKKKPSPCKKKPSPSPCKKESPCKKKKKSPCSSCKKPPKCKKVKKPCKSPCKRKKPSPCKKKCSGRIENSFSRISKQCPHMSIVQSEVKNIKGQSSKTCGRNSLDDSCNPCLHQYPKNIICNKPKVCAIKKGIRQEIPSSTRRKRRVVSCRKKPIMCKNIPGRKRKAPTFTTDPCKKKHFKSIYTSSSTRDKRPKSKGSTASLMANKASYNENVTKLCSAPESKSRNGSNTRIEEIPTNSKNTASISPPEDYIQTTVVPLDNSVNTYSVIIKKNIQLSSKLKDKGALKQSQDNKNKYSSSKYAVKPDAPVHIPVNSKEPSSSMTYSFLNRLRLKILSTKYSTCTNCTNSKDCNSDTNMYSREDVYKARIPFQPPRIYRVPNLTEKLPGKSICKDQFSTICKCKALKNLNKNIDRKSVKPITCNDYKFCCQQRKNTTMTCEMMDKLEETIQSKQCISSNAMKNIPALSLKTRTEIPRYLQILKRIEEASTKTPCCSDEGQRKLSRSGLMADNSCPTKCTK